MDPNSQNEFSAESRKVFEGQIRECYGRVVYSHKTHEKCADILLSRLSKIKIWQIVLSAISTGGFLAAILGAGEIGAVAGMVVSTLLLVLNAYTKNYDLGELAQKHRQAAGDLWLTRELYLSLLVDLAMKKEPLGTLQKRRDELSAQLHQIYAGAPSTTFKAYRKAQKALQQLEDMTFKDGEIDAFLPAELKRTK